MRSFNPVHRFTCATCATEITGTAVFHLGLAFCCASCAAAGPCVCSADRPTPDPGVAAPDVADGIRAGRVRADRRIPVAGSAG